MSRQFFFCWCSLLLMAAGFSGRAQVVQSIADLGPTCSLCKETPRHLMEYQGALYTAINRSGSGPNFFKFDGNNVSSFSEVVVNGSHSYARQMEVFNGDLILLGNDTLGSPMGVWRFDGTNFDPIPLEDNPTVVGAWVDFTPYDNHLYFSGFDHPHPGLWRYDGDSIRKVTVANAPAFDAPADFTVWQGKLYFTATDTANNRRVWHYDGSTISLVTAIPPLFDVDCCGSNIIAYQGKLFFVHDDGIHGHELWQYNGFKSVLAADAWPGAQGSYPRALTIANNQLYMLASDSLNDAKIMAYNGTQLSEIAPYLHVPLDFTRRPLSGYNGSLYFTGYPAKGLRFDSIAIYQYDGQEAHVVVDSMVAYGWLEFDGALYFGGADHYRTADLWKITAPLVNVSVPQQGDTPAAFRVYPNPSDGLLTVAWEAEESAPGTIRILDLLGREVHRFRVERPLAGQQEVLNMGDHAPGMYTVIFEAGAARHVKRLILR